MPQRNAAPSSVGLMLPLLAGAVGVFLLLLSAQPGWLGRPEPAVSAHRARLHPAAYGLAASGAGVLAAAAVGCKRFVDRRRARRAAQGQTAGLDPTLLETIPDVVYELDPKGRFTFLSDAVRRFGYAPEDLLGKRFSYLVHPDDFPAVSRLHVLPRYEGASTGEEAAPKLFDERRSGDRGTRDLEVRLVPGDGIGVRHGEVHASGRWATDGADGRPRFVGTVGIIRDVTQRKELARRLERSRASFQAIVTKSHNGILVVDEEGTVRYVNPAAEHLLERQAHHLLGEPFGMPLVDDEVTDIDIRLRNGRTGTAEMRVTETVWQGAPACLVTLHDVTERDRMEQELEAARQAAEEASHAKSEFLANVSHELRTPLNAIIGFSEGLLHRVDQHPLTEHQRDRVEKVLLSGRHLLALIDQVLDIAKIEAGRLTLEPTTFDVYRLAATVQSMADAMLHDTHGVRFAMDVADDLPALTSDRAKVQQILLNLLGNAVKYTRRGSITLSVRREGDGIAFRMQDTGVGIPEDQRGKIFEPFERVDRADGKGAAEGHGRGLAIARSLAERLGGSLVLEPDSDDGCTFALTVPTAWDEPAETENEGNTHQYRQAVKGAAT
jgi:PAS domain S-box-containing protein